MRKRQLALVLAMVASIGLLSAAPAMAEDSNTGTSNDSSTATETNQSTDDQSSVREEIAKLRTEAKDTLEAERAHAKVQNTQERQKACEARQGAIDRRVSNYAKAAQTNLDTFSSILTKVQAFYTSKQLNVATYPGLLATAQSKQTAAQTAVDTLKGLNVSIDCTQPDPAATVAAVKTAVADARTALQAYRSAIKDVIVTLEGASSAHTDTNSTTTTGGQQ